jgi:hypothetical protein
MWFFVIAKSPQVFGAPTPVANGFAMIALVFASISAVAGFSKSPFWIRNWPKALMGIAVLNAMFGLASLGSMISLYKTMLPLGRLYFVSELLILTWLVPTEWRIATRSLKANRE